MEFTHLIKEKATIGIEVDLSNTQTGRNRPGAAIRRRFFATDFCAPFRSLRSTPFLRAFFFVKLWGLEGVDEVVFEAAGISPMLE